MKFLANECCDQSLVKALRADGHNVLYASEEMPGVSDDEILNRAFADERVLITEDKDFGELVIRLGKPLWGLILLRFEVQERKRKILRLRELLEKRQDQLEKAIVVLDNHKFRIRPINQ
ncbi:MAG: DUF5615 family PIN-like protein [Anaerolineaceae bacterium]|nr:DUF5615 family PIN-like protein [Anaerolineaceae bacterium]